MDDLPDRAVLFAHVAEHGSFSAAARALGRSASSVSRQLDALEDDLGVTLLHRTTRRLRLTEAGEALLPYANRMARDAREARDLVSGLGAAPSGHLRVSVPAGLALEHISPLLPEFFARYPDVEVGLELSDRVVDLVTERFDVAIRFGRLPDSELRQRKLADSDSAVCASPAYLRRWCVPQNPADLADHGCLSFKTAPGPRIWRFRRDDERTEVHVSGPLSVNSGVGLAAAALAGLGVVMLPSWHVAAPLRDGRLCRLLPDWDIDPPSSPVHAVFAPGRYVAPKVRVFVDFLAESFANARWAVDG